MIEEIEIRDLGVIEHARLAPGPGFTAITGETGAGKTMLLTALDLLMGGKADPALVRAPASMARVDGRFADVVAAVAQIADDAGSEVEDGELLLARTVAAQGRSRAHLGGRGVTQSVLADLADHLVTVHGQSDQIQLRSASRQRQIIDSFAGGGQADLLTAMRTAHQEVRDRGEALAQARSSARTRELEVASLTTALEEIDAAEIAEGEDLALREEADRLDNVEVISDAVLAARSALTGAEGIDGAVTLLERAARSLTRVAGHDSGMAALAQQLSEQAVVVADLDGELGAQIASLEADPARLDEVHARRAQLSALGRSYGMAFDQPQPEDPPAGSSDAVLAWARGARARLAELTGPGYDIADLEAALAAAQQRRDELAGQITANRTEAGAQFAHAVTAELRELAMPNAEVSVDVAPTQPGPTGADTVSILLAPHPGAPARPLGQGASGGELSRVMLALEVALAQRTESESARTFVFDEVDAGIGGRTAGQVGERLASLAATSQVVVVTHLAQVAACADTHIVVEKDPEAPDGAVTTVREVTGTERTDELARMLSGETTATARRHANDLLKRSGVRR